MARSSIKASLVEVTPKLAAQWLRMNKKNRPLSGPTVDHYASQVHKGSWELTGDTIKFNGDGDLIDGQHRLRAIIQAGKPIKTLIVRGVPSTAFDRLDTGRTRNLRDVLALDGELTGNAATDFSVASAMRWVYRLSTDPTLGRKGRLTNHEILTFCQNLKGFKNSLKFGELSREITRSTALGMALHYLFSKKDRELADAFFIGLGEGAGLEAESPLHHLRERMIKDNMSKARIPRKDALATMIKTWNIMRAGNKTCTRQAISWTGRGPSAEDFPKIQ